MESHKYGGLVLFSFAFGWLCLFLGLRVKMGYDKGHFLSQRSFNIPKDIHYAYWPLGVGFLLFALGVISSSDPNLSAFADRLWDNVALGGLLGGFGLSVLFMIIKPKFVKPKWLLWLEAHYDRATVAYMFDQARRNPKSWEWKISTQEGLEKWAAEMAQQYEAQFFIRPRNS